VDVRSLLADEPPSTVSALLRDASSSFIRRALLVSRSALAREALASGLAACRIMLPALSSWLLRSGLSAEGHSEGRELLLNGSFKLATGLSAADDLLKIRRLPLVKSLLGRGLIADDLPVIREVPLGSSVRLVNGLGARGFSEGRELPVAKSALGGLVADNLSKSSE